MTSIVEKNSGYVLGIDLGTTNTAVAFFRGGDAQIINIDGAKTMPSVMSVLKNGEIATFHRLGNRDVKDIESELKQVTEHRPISLILPFIPVEMQGQGLPRIIEDLQQVKYLKNIIVAMGTNLISRIRFHDHWPHRTAGV